MVRLVCLLLALVCCSCASPARVSGPFPAPWVEEGSESQGEEEGSVVEGSVSTLGAIFLYLPNRIFDLFEIVRFGVNLGPGLGLDARVTRYAQATLMTRTSVGVGLQGLRRLPVSAATESGAAVGPVRSDASLGLGWPLNPGDIRVEPHLFLVGAHVAVDTFAIGDFLAGLIGLDPSGDDFGF